MWLLPESPPTFSSLNQVRLLGLSASIYPPPPPPGLCNFHCLMEMGERPRFKKNMYLTDLTHNLLKIPANLLKIPATTSKSKSLYFCMFKHYLFPILYNYICLIAFINSYIPLSSSIVYRKRPMFSIKESNG